MGLFKEQRACSSYSESLLAMSPLKKILISSSKMCLQLFPPVLANILEQLSFYRGIFTHYKCNLSQVIIACNTFLLQYQGTDIYSGLRRCILLFPLDSTSLQALGLRARKMTLNSFGK